MRIEVSLYLASIIIILLRNWKDSHLIRRQPEWEVTRCVLNEYSCEAFERAKWRTVNHHRRLLRIILSRIFKLETVRKVIINLDSSQLPTTTNSILYHEIELRTIESSLTKFYTSLETFLLTGSLNSSFTLLPNLIRANILLLIIRITQ